MLAIDQVAVDIRASDFAFRAGQLVERLLLDRGLQLARQAGCSVATAEHMESCLDRGLFDQVRGISRGEIAEAGRARTGESREAA